MIARAPAPLPSTALRALVGASAWLPVLVWLAAGATLVKAAAAAADARASDSFPWFAVTPTALNTVAIAALGMALAVPLGVAGGLHLAANAHRRPVVHRWLDALASALATAPPLLYGLAVLEIAVRGGTDPAAFGWGVFATAFTLAPAVLHSTRLALAEVPRGLELTALGLGAPPRRVLFRVMLPAAGSRIATGALVGMARSLGDAAPLLVLGAAAWSTALPDSVDAPLAALPVSIFYALSGAEAGAHPEVASAMIALVALALTLQLGAYGLVRLTSPRN